MRSTEAPSIEYAACTYTCASLSSMTTKTLASAVSQITAFTSDENGSIRMSAPASTATAGVYRYPPPEESTKTSFVAVAFDQIRRMAQRCARVATVCPF